ncbi:MAG TPA: thiamine phosphate synthase, partial [Burkholderiaceae bacterium]|nr:thiamine phosphate synthase [Burkholderiaceae bacterium]
FYRVRERCRAHGARLLVSSRHPPSYWRAADGVHLTAADLAAARTRPPLPLVAASCHDSSELERAGALGCDFAVLGPVRATPSHPQQPPLGWQRFAQQIALTPVPVYALGGLQPAHLPQAAACGAHGIAMLRHAWR